jgi:GNAT superfamily N-acetyltransferase
MIHIRHARLDDLSSLAAVRYHDRPAIHRDRIQQSDSNTMHYYVAEYEQQIVGFGVLLLERPADWTDRLNSFPILIDLYVAEAYRSCGVGQALILHAARVRRSYAAVGTAARDAAPVHARAARRASGAPGTGLPPRGRVPD